MRSIKDCLFIDLFESVSEIIISVCEVWFELNGVVEGLDGAGKVPEIVVAAAQITMSNREVCLTFSFYSFICIN